MIWKRFFDFSKQHGAEVQVWLTPGVSLKGVVIDYDDSCVVVHLKKNENPGRGNTSVVLLDNVTTINFVDQANSSRFWNIAVKRPTLSLRF
jgi:hypothetical protein